MGHDTRRGRPNWWYAALLALLLVGAWPSSARAVENLPLEEVRPGMAGIGRTVFEGSRVEEFQVFILGVLENVLGPRQSMILARLEGGPLAQTGVIAGMSGSPVFIDGKLVGAVAYGFPFSKETIAGITPIGEMIEATRTDTPRAASNRFILPRGAHGLAMPLDRDALVAALRRPAPAAAAVAGTFRGAVPQLLGGQRPTPLALPMVFRGFDPTAFEWARGVFSDLGFAPVLGGGGAAPNAALPDLEPGGAVGVSLVEGDLDLSVTGTITHIEDGRVYAFGHPFYNLGPTQFPMKKAYVYSVFPSLYSSFKISAAFDAVGTIEQDRSTGIAGHIGKTPRMIPVEVKIATSRGQERNFSFRIVDDELFSPVLAYVSVLSVLQGNERAFGTSTIRVDGKVSLAGGREVRVEDLFAEGQPAAQASGLVAAPLAYLMTNDFERVQVERVDINVTSYETVRTAVIERVWLERSGPIRPGSVVPLKLQLRTYRGETVSEMVPVSIPANARPGAYSLLVSDAAALTALEQREMRQPFAPRNLEQLVRAINGLRRNNRVYARLLRPEEGAIVSGEYLQSLPSSVLSVLGTPEQGNTVTPVRTATVWDFELPTEFTVSGSRSLSLVVER